MTSTRHIVLSALAAPLVLALAACGSEADIEETELSGEPIEPIAAPEGTTWLETVTVTDADGYMVGNPDAPLKLIEYGSLTCGACAYFAQTGMEPLKQNYVSTGVVSYELRNQVHNGYDLVLARLIRCGQPEGVPALAEQVWLNFDAVMGPLQADQALLGEALSLSEDQRYVAVAEAYGLLDFFAARGISRDQARACLSDSDEVLAIANRSDEQSTELGVDSTPTFILNGRVLDERSWDQLETVLQRAGAPKAS